MAILDDVLREEYDRSKRILSAYKKELSKLPKGSIIEKNIHGHKYPYLQYRDGKQVKSQYIRPDRLEEMQKQVARRKELEDAIKRLGKEKKKLEKVLGNG